MWADRNRSWIHTVVLGGFALPHIWSRTLIVTAISVIVTIVYEEIDQIHYSITATPFTLVGLSLGVFLGFRNNSAYDRFWEGRKLWGSLVNTSRSITRQLLTLIEPAPGDGPAADASARRGVHLVIAFVHALRHHLRESDPSESLAAVLPASEAERLAAEDNVPLAILTVLGDHVRDARREGRLHVMHVPVLEASLVSLTDIQGACERIKSTPIPFSYTVLMHRIVAFYCALLPFGLMDTIKWATPFVVLAISYCFFGLDAIGDEIEQPFGTDTNDLALEAISRTIERNLRRSLDEPMPPPLAPARGVLT